MENPLKETIITNVSKEIETIRSQGILLKLAVILVGDDSSSQVYVKSIEKMCKKLSVGVNLHKLEESSSDSKLKNLIQSLNQDRSVHGILCQFPLPSNFSNSTVTDNISTFKDVDSISPKNVSRWETKIQTFIPCTPLAVLEILSHYDIQTEGKEIVIVGRSHTVGRPLSVLLSNPNYNATVTLCHSKTKNLKEITRRADILISAIGKANFIKSDFVKESATVIDVGINYLEDSSHPKGGYLVGDIDKASFENFNGPLTPVPGGVGPVTISTLISNTLKAYKLSI